MRRTMKRAVSVLLALAMVVTSLSYTPKTVEAADDDLTFTELKLDGQDTIWYAIKDQAFTGWGNPFYGDGGITLMFGYSADVGTVTVTIGGEEKTVENSEGLITEIFVAGIKFNPQKLPKTGRTEITLTDANNTSMTLVITKEDPTGTTNPTDPTDPSDPVEPTLDWKTDANLTAVLGEGTKYAVDGSADGIDYFIEETGIRFLGGGFGTGAIITLNGKEVYNGGYAIPNYTINYSELSAGENIIELTADYNFNDVQKTCNLKLYINTPTRPTNGFVRDYVKYTGKYVFKFGEVDGATAYNVYVDESATPVATIDGSGDYITASELEGITAGEHNFYLTAVLSNTEGVSEETIKSEAIPFTYSEQVGNNNEIAQIYVQTDDLTKDAMSFDKNIDGKVSSAITIVDKDGKTSDIFEDKTKTTIKVRGNSTANAQKKAFNISFSKAKNVFGFGSAKKWCLLANAFDKTLIRNKLAMDFALNVMGLNETGNSQYIDLYLNGVYMGNYLLIEAVEVGESRVNIQSESVNSNDILIELEGLGPNGNGKVEDGVRYITTNGITGNNDQVHFNIGSPENGDGIDGTGVDGEMTEEELKAKDDYAVQFLNQFEQDLANDDYTAYSQYVDIKSFVDFYIVNELFKNKDFSYSSTRFYIKDNKLYAGPLWDLDLSSGNVKDENGWTATESPLYCQDMPWFKALMKNETFAEAVAQRFAEVKEEAVALYSGDNNKIDALVGENGEIIASARRNYAATEDGGAGWSETAADPSDGYSNASSGKNFEESVEWLRTWLGQRTDYLSRLWIGNNEAPDYSNINVADDDWTLVGADADGNKWYYATSYRVAMDGSGYAVLIDNPGADGYGDGEANTIKSAALGLGAGNNARTADSVWFNDTKLAANSETYYQSTTANDVLFFAQSLFEVGKISYITVRAADGNDYILPVKVEAEKAPENNADLTKGWTKLPVKYDNNHTIDDLAYDYYINTAIWGNGVNVNESSVCVSHTATGYHGNVADTCKLADNANSLTLYLNTWNLSTAWIDGTKYTFGDGNYAGGNNDTHEFALDLFDLGTHYVTLLNNNGEVVYDFAIKAVEKDADPNEDPDTISPMENVPEEVANAEWTSIGENTGFYYYDPEHIEGQANGTVQTTSIKGTLMTIGTWVSALVTAKIGDVSFDKVKDSAQLTISTTLFKKDGIYQVDVDDNGKAHTFYIKKETPADYTATNVTVADVTATGATISWTPSQAAIDASYTYKVLIDGVEEGTAINATYTYEADLSDGAEHKVVIQTVDGDGNVVATSKEATFKYSDEPDYYDVALEKVEITGDFTVGSTITMTATIKNVGKALTITSNDNPKLVLQFMKNVDVENDKYGDNGEGLVDGTWYQIIDYNDQNSTLKLGSTFAYGDTFTYTWSRTVQQGLIDLIDSTGSIDFRVNPEGGDITLDGTQTIEGVRTFRNNYYSYVVTAPVPNPTNVTATLNDNNGIDVTWEAPDEENTYTYEVWLNGVKVADVTDATSYTITDGITDGVNTVTVKAVLDDKSSSGVSTSVLNYDASDAKWVQWDNANKIDKNENAWYLAENKLDYNDVWKGDANYLQITNSGKQYLSVIKDRTTGAALTAITTVTINGTTYQASKTDTDPVYNDGGDQLFLDVDLFTVPEGQKEKVYAVTVTGTMDQKTTTKSYLVKVVNTNYIAAVDPVDVVATADQDNKSASVRWSETQEMKDAGYKYNVYLDDATVPTYEQVEAGEYKFENLTEGVHTITVKSVTEEGESTGVSRKVFIYTVDDANWKSWTFGSDNTGTTPTTKDIDANGNTWEYYNGYDWSKLDMGANGWVGLYNSGINENTLNTDIPASSFEKEATLEIPILGENNINIVTINGVAYPIGIDEDVHVEANRVYIKQSLFKLGSKEKEKVFALTFTGANQVDTAVLVRVTNNNLEQFNFENVQGTDVATWNAVDEATSYKITYIVNGEEKTAEITDLTDLSYTFKDDDGNNIYPDNNTAVTIKAYDVDGNEITDSTKQVIAKADLEITNVGTPDGAIIGENPTITVSYINKGTARATLTRDAFYAIKVVGAGNWYQSTDFLAPNETATAQFEVVGLNLTEGYNDLKVEIDEGNRVAESDETNNIKDFKLFAVEKDAVKIEYVENLATFGQFVKATWNKIDGATGYHFTYMSNGVEKTDIIDMNLDNYLKETEDGSQYYCGVGSAIDTGTTFKVYATLADGSKVLVGVQEAKADLIVSEVSTPETTRVGYPFNVQVSIKNIGTGQVRPKPIDGSFEEGYANHTIAAAVTWVDADGKKQWIVNDSYTDGIAAGFTVVRDLNGIIPSVAGENIEFTYWADHYGNSENDDVVEFINESNEDNNTLVKTYNVEERKQNTEMDWTRLVSDDAGWAPVGTEYLFPVASGSQNAYIDYKVIDTNITDWDYDQIVERYVGYAGANMTIAFNNYGDQYVTYEDNTGASSKTRLDFAQIPGYTVDNDADIATGISNAKWIQLATQNVTVYDEDGNSIAPIAGESPVSYNGNGINFFVGNFGLLKYYAMRFTTPTLNEETGEYEDKYITLAFRVTDDAEHTGAWQQALASDKASNPNTLPVYYCGADTENYKDVTDHEATEGISLYETTGALWYDARDILLSSISVYNGNWLAIATSQYLQFDKGDQDGKNMKYRVGIARAEFSKDGAYEHLDHEAFKNTIIDPNENGVHLGIEGTNTIQIGLPWLLEKLPVHSAKGGEKDQEFYWLRIYADYENIQETTNEQFANYVDIPIAIYADIPEIQKPQNVTAQTITDDEDQEQVMVSWSSLPEQDVYGYKYDVYIGDTKILPTEGYYDKGEVVTFNSNDYADALAAAGNKVTVKAYWCEQVTSVDVEIQEAKKAGWYPIEGDDTIGIQAGDSKPVDMPGTISYYYGVKDNHANAVVGYNGDYISINGNTKYFNENSTVSVYNGFKSRDEVEEAKTKVKDGTGNYDFVKVTPYNYFEGQLQIIAKDLMTAHHETTCYLVKVETPNPEDAENPYVTYLMLESKVQTEGDVAVRGYQMNTDATPGAASEKGPSFRVVSRASKVVTVLATDDTEDNKSIQAIVAQGTIYGLGQNIASDDMEVQYDKDTGKVDTVNPDNPNVKQFQSTSLEHTEDGQPGGLFTGWEGIDADEDGAAYNYYAVTFKSQNATVTTLKAGYSLKAYAVAEDGTVIYEDYTVAENGTKTYKNAGNTSTSVKGASIENIAATLYSGSLMPTEMAHNYLYDNVLNVVAISDNRTSIVRAALTQLNITSTKDTNYKYVNQLNKDLYNYTYLAGPYNVKYVERGAFVSKSIVEGKTNDVALAEALGASTVANWMESKGYLYTKVPYNHTTGSVDVVKENNN